MPANTHTNADERSLTRTLELPTMHAVISNAPSPEKGVIREDILNNLGEGTHHTTPDLPTEGTSLPPVKRLQEAVTAVNEYLYNAGAAVVASAHLQGLAAIAHTTPEPDSTVYAYLDNTIFTDLVKSVLSDMDTEPSPGESAFNELTDAVVCAYAFEFAAVTQDHDSGIDSPAEADWPTVRGQQTEDLIGIVFPTPHPLPELDEYPTLPERGIALAAGMQRLAADLDDVYSQRDIAYLYLPAYLRAHGLTAQQANALVANWYDVPGECVTSVSEDLAKEIQSRGFPVSDPEFAYYLTEPAFEELAEVTGLNT